MSISDQVAAELLFPIQFSEIQNSTGFQEGQEKTRISRKNESDRDTKNTARKKLMDPDCVQVSA